MGNDGADQGGGSIGNGGLAHYGGGDNTVSYAYLHAIGRAPIFSAADQGVGGMKQVFGVSYQTDEESQLVNAREGARSLGIDPTKDAQLAQYGRLAPGRHGYLGAFLFVGELRTPGPHARLSSSDGLDAALSASAPPRPRAFEALPVVALDFHAEAVPWVLDEPEID